MGNLILSAFLHYLEAHPDLIEKLIEAIINAVLAHQPKS